ncbi:MAG: hypothetical protein J6U54_21970 [Clostridiales bacterium]|nr:hypothetical protein [Clostridiales bacterium]
MKKTNAIVAGILIASMVFGIAGCSLFKKDRVTHENFCAALEKTGAEKTDDLDDVYSAVSRMYSEEDDGIYFTSEDDDDAQDIYDILFNRFNQHPDADIEKSTVYYYTNTEDKCQILMFVFTFEKEKKAQKIFDSLDENISDDEDADSGKIDEYEYSISYYKEDSRAFADGLYISGNNVLYIRSISKTGDGTDRVDDIVKEMGLISPCDK